MTRSYGFIFPLSFQIIGKNKFLRKIPFVKKLRTITLYTLKLFITYKTRLKNEAGKKQIYQTTTKDSWFE